MSRYSVQIHTVKEHDVCMCPLMRPALSGHRHKARAFRAARLVNSKLGCARHVAVVVHHSALGEHVERP